MIFFANNVNPSVLLMLVGLCALAGMSQMASCWRALKPYLRYNIGAPCGLKSATFSRHPVL
jgi:hypothetical protein